MSILAEEIKNSNILGEEQYTDEQLEWLANYGDVETDIYAPDEYMPLEACRTPLETNEDTLLGCSPSDVPWDIHKANLDLVRGLYVKYDGNRNHLDRMGECAEWLLFYVAYRQAKDETEKKTWRLKLANASFCKVRGCPVCAWRRSLRMKGIAIYERLPRILELYPTHRFIFLTLTVKNCSVSTLRDTVRWMNEAWRRMRARDFFVKVVQGWFRSVEFTRGTDGVTVHPHFHILLHVKASYFSAKGGYMTQAQYTDMWKECLGVDYTPVVNVKAVRRGGEIGSIKEVMKYAVKEADIQDMVADGSDWYVRVFEQLHGAKLITSSGTLKFLATRTKDETKPSDPENKEDLLDIGHNPDEDEEIVDLSRPYRFYYNHGVAQYMRDKDWEEKR